MTEDISLPKMIWAAHKAVRDKLIKIASPSKKGKKKELKLSNLKNSKQSPKLINVTPQPNLSLD